MEELNSRDCSVGLLVPLPSVLLREYLGFRALFSLALSGLESLSRSWPIESYVMRQPLEERGD